MLIKLLTIDPIQKNALYKNLLISFVLLLIINLINLPIFLSYYNYDLRSYRNPFSTIIIIYFFVLFISIVMSILYYFANGIGILSKQWKQHQLGINLLRTIMYMIYISIIIGLNGIVIFLSVLNYSGFSGTH